MAKEYKTLVFPDTIEGRVKMAKDIDALANDGWEVKSKEVSDQGWDAGKTCCLGALFLPLALLGKKEKVITLIMEREKGRTENQNSTGEK
ncbi:MAG: hypothetical protein ABSC29_01720 [Minisyncoccia bacterium]|jgi:hypothetical protein